MKRLVFSLKFLLVAFLITSCSKESAELILGKWHAVSYKKNNVEILNSVPELTNLYIEFNSNNSGTQYSSADTSSFNYTITNDTILTIQANGSIDWIIKNISDDDMKLRRTEGSNTFLMELEKH